MICLERFMFEHNCKWFLKTSELNENLVVSSQALESLNIARATRAPIIIPLIESSFPEELLSV